MVQCFQQKEMFEHLYCNILGKRKTNHQNFNSKFSSFDGNVFFEVTDIIKDQICLFQTYLLISIDHKVPVLL